NTCAGISIISQEAPLFQELAGVTAVVAASMVGLASIGNAVGRVFWAWISDLITRRATFFVMFVTQVLLFWFFPNIVTASLLTILVRPPRTRDAGTTEIVSHPSTRALAGVRP